MGPGSAVFLSAVGADRLSRDHKETVHVHRRAPSSPDLKSVLQNTSDADRHTDAAHR